MRVIKRGNLAILSLSLMIMIAGYINYRYDPKREENLGKTVLVNNDSSYVYVDSNQTDVYNEASTRDETLYKNKSSEAVHKIKSNRDDMYSELEESYKEVIQTSSNQENIKLYQDKLDNIIKEKNKINLIETIMKTKGIENLAINKVGEKVMVVVSKENLTESEIAIIKKMINDELNVKSENISITNE